MEDKLKQALEIINKNGFVSVKDLTAQLAVSRSTSDRYLQILETKRAIKRVQGGAVALRKDFAFCPDYYYSDVDDCFQERIRMAQKAVEMIDAKDCVFVSGGRTGLHIARELKLRNKKTTIITNSLPVALLLAGVCSVNLAGITPTNNEGILIGPMPINFPVNKAFITPGSVNEDGFYNATPMIVQLEYSFVQKAKTTIMLINTETYANNCPYKMCSYDEVNLIITPETAPDFIRNKKVEVCYVGEKRSGG